jgi:O-antigen ligase
MLVASVAASIAFGVLAALGPGLALLGILAVAFVPIVVVSPIAGLCGLTLLTFLEEYSAISGAVSGTKLLGALLILAWAAAAATKVARDRSERGLLRDQPALCTFLVLFAAWACMSITWAESSGAAQGAVGRYVLNFLLFPIVYLAVRQPQHVTWLVAVFIAGSLVAVGFGVLTGNVVESEDRLKGAGLNANQLGGYLVAAAIFAATVAAYRRWPIGTRGLALVIAAVAGVSVLMTGSRGALVSLAVAFGVAPLVLGKGRRLGALALVLAAVLGSIWWYVALAPASVVERVTHPAEGGGSGREDLWRVGWRMVEAQPVHGVGAGNFPESSVHYLLRPGRTDRDEIIVDDKKVAHNIYLTVLSELGAVGFALFVAILGICVRCALKAARDFARQGSELMELIARALVISLISLLAAGFFSSAVYSKQMWLLLALAPALLALAESQRAAERVVLRSGLQRWSGSSRAGASALRGATF